MKNDSGEHSGGHFDSWLASKAQPYNGRGLSYAPLLPSGPVPLLGLQHTFQTDEGPGM